MNRTAGTLGTLLLCGLFLAGGAFGQRRAAFASDRIQPTSLNGLKLY